MRPAMQQRGNSAKIRFTEAVVLQGLSSNRFESDTIRFCAVLFQFWTPCPHSGQDTFHNLVPLYP